MKIAYLTTIYPKTSHSFIRREIREIERRGHTVQRFAIRRPSEPLVHLPDLEELEITKYCMAGGPAHLMQSAVRESIRSPLRFLRAMGSAFQMGRVSGRGFIRNFAYLAQAAWLRHQLRRDPVDHLHVHFGSNPAAVARLLRMLGGPPYSVTFHGPDEWDDPRGLSLEAKIHDARFVVTVSSFGRAQALRWAPANSPAKVIVIRSGAPDALFDGRTRIAETSKIFLFVGRLSAQKAPLLLLDAFERVADEDPGARLVVVGEGELEEEVRQRILENRLVDRVDLTGALPEPEILSLLRQARCFVLPSFAEGLPVVLIEALAQARPAISTLVAGIPELIVPNETGWLIPAGSSELLAEAMLKVLDTPAEELNEMGESGARFVRDHHDLKEQVDRLEQAFGAGKAETCE